MSNVEGLEALYRDHVKNLQERYGRVMQEAGFDVVVIHSGALVKRTNADDQFWPLRPTPHFQHWLPLAEVGCALVVQLGQKPKLAWLKVKNIWEQPPALEADFFTRALDVEIVHETIKIKDILPAGIEAGRVAFIGDHVGDAVKWGIVERAVNPAELVGRLDRLRATKTPYEVACLAEANRRAGVGHDAVLAAFRQGQASELDLHLAYLRATAQDDPETPYKNIVAQGPHAATLHHVSYAKRPSSRAAESLLVDAGATYLGYCSDITRTWVKGSDAEASAFGGLIAGMEAMQKRLCAQVKVGAPYEELHEDSHRQLGVVLREAGVTKVSSEEAVAAGITRAFYPHGLGHSLGLQCHDVGCALVKPKQNNPYLRNTSAITVGQCFTVEPGVYFIEPLLADLKAGEHAGKVDWTVIDAMKKLGGVRIEDDLVVIGGEGVTRNLTREVLPVGGGA